ncbi:hypothetical protein B0F90DRAFT_1709386 [Multifurca ochricompacta]|uniref:Uncharacterized protein n=1 Tax=Multifurca ochricompacta TaxID=376703 RepID=A0AAD4M8Y2_9AGAM|nr:hypothetical protein B0F90DRAFT_1709386 [Multifurca ochricompacta]
MSSHHDLYCQPPTHAYTHDTPRQIAHMSAPALSAPTLVSTSRSHPLPPPCHPQQPLPPDIGVHANSQPLNPGSFPRSPTGCYVPPRFVPPPNTSQVPPTPDFKLKQRVRARISADAWVMGVIVSVLHICSKFTGRGYVVEFESVEGTGQYETREFSAQELNPY